MPGRGQVPDLLVQSVGRWLEAEGLGRALELARPADVDPFASPAKIAVGETVILLQPPPLPLAGVSIWMERGCQ